MGELFTGGIKRKNLYLVHSIDLYYVHLYTFCICLGKESTCPCKNPVKSFSFDDLKEAEYFIDRYRLRCSYGKVELTQERHPEIDSARMRRRTSDDEIVEV